MSGNAWHRYVDEVMWTWQMNPTSRAGISLQCSKYIFGSTFHSLSPQKTFFLNVQCFRDCESSEIYISQSFLYKCETLEAYISLHIDFLHIFVWEILRLMLSCEIHIM